MGYMGRASWFFLGGARGDNAREARGFADELRFHYRWLRVGEGLFLHEERQELDEEFWVLLLRLCDGGSR